MKKSEIRGMRKIINESLIHNALFNSIESTEKKIKAAVAKHEKENGKLAKFEQNKINKAIKLLDEVNNLLFDVLE